MRPALLLFGFVAAVWAPALGGDFVWDDVANLVRSDRLKSWSALYEAFLHDAMWSAEKPGVGTYRPLALASMALEHQLFGGAAWGHHLGSILLHALTAVAVFAALSRFVDRACALGIAAVWAVHPSAVEVAAWINGRSESFALLFGATAMWVLCVQAPSRRRLALGGGLLLLAMFGKETGAIFAPGVVLLAAYAQGDGRVVHRPTAVVAGLALAAFFTVRALVLTGGGVSAGAEVLAVVPAVWWRATQGVVFPVDRGLHHLGPWLSGLDTGAVVAYSVATLGAAALTALAWVRGRRLVALGLAWWCASLLPVALLVSSAWPGFYRWLYIGLPGLLLAIYAGALEGRRAARWVAAVALVLGILLSERAIPAWRTSGTLFLTMGEEQPELPYGYHGLGEYLRDIGDYKNAELVLRQGLALPQPRADMYVALSSVLVAQGRCAEAVAAVRGRVARVPPKLVTLLRACR